ncbi:MAG TPA: hypothetical protein VFO82_06200 [Steroidobacteraceae bacterium]|nr:hypothetical protein [Steroidobacteraceae bacterium]
MWAASRCSSSIFPAPIRAQAMSGAFGLLAAFVVSRHVPETKGLDPTLLGAFWRRQSLDSAQLARG